MALQLAHSKVIKNGNSSPLYSHTLNEFIAAGTGRNSGVINYDTMCYQKLLGNVKYCVKNVLDDYIRELKGLSVNILLNKDEIKRYNYNPKLLCADVYGNTDMYFIILLLNGLCDVKEFKNINPVKMLPVSVLEDTISSILINELDNIKINNSIHT